MSTVLVTLTNNFFINHFKFLGMVENNCNLGDPQNHYPTLFAHMWV